jgi:hypothetical protein
MFSFLNNSKDEVKKTDSSTDSSDDEASDNEETIFGDPIYKNLYFELYMVSARLLCNNVGVWSSNRQLNKEHVQALEEGIYKSKHIIGSIKIMRNKKLEYRVFDGQHRIQTLKNIFAKDANFNIELLVEMYESDFDSTEALTLFSKANNVKNISSDDMPHNLAHKVAGELSKKYPEVFVTPIGDHRINRPRIDKKVLYQSLKDTLEKVSTDETKNYPKTEQEILEAIEKLNKIYGTKKIEGFECSVKTYRKAEIFGFYLGLLDTKTWINLLKK